MARIGAISSLLLSRPVVAAAAYARGCFPGAGGSGDDAALAWRRPVKAFMPEAVACLETTYAHAEQ